MKKYIKINWFAVASLAVIVLGSFSALIARGDVNSAVSYLSNKSFNAWVSMALVAAGQTPDVNYLKTLNATQAVDFEAPILALTAAGKDPRSFGNTDLIALLKSFYSGGQIGDAQTLNDDIFGVLALVSAGVPASDPVVFGAKDFILSHQNSDGGWAFSVGGGSDTNMTSVAIAALLEAGVSSSDATILKAVSYLKNAQNDDGGFPYDPKSSYGRESDASSDAWVISALNKLGIDPKSWKKGEADPVSNLLSFQADAGYFKFQANSSEDAFSPVTTSYAVIALLGKSFPVGKISVSQAVPVTINFRIEGKNAQVCSGSLDAVTALEVVKLAAAKCNFTYNIKDTSFGPYLDQIGLDTAQGAIGWLYLVNFSAPDIGAQDYRLKADDNVVWHYGDFLWKPMRISLSSSQVSSGAPVLVTVQGFNASSSWSPLARAVLHAGTLTFSTNDNDQATLNLTDGIYNIFAEKDGYIRSGKEQVIVGQPSQMSLDLSVNILSGENSGGGSGGGQSSGTTFFSVELASGGNSLNFGSFSPGKEEKRSVVLKNQSTSRLTVISTVSGDSLFRNYLEIDNAPWNAYSAVILVNSAKNSEVELPIPLNYALTGLKTGKLIFWATPTP